MKLQKEREENRDISIEQFVCIKQFAVTNYSKERPGSITTETLKNRILIPIVTSKESHFNADFKYTFTFSYCFKK